MPNASEKETVKMIDAKHVNSPEFKGPSSGVKTRYSEEIVQQDGYFPEHGPLHMSKLPKNEEASTGDNSFLSGIRAP